MISKKEEGSRDEQGEQPLLGTGEEIYDPTQEQGSDKALVRNL